MKVGQEIRYVDTVGARHPATVAEITGSGRSHFKTLNLTYKQNGEEVEVRNVRHVNDAEEGDGFWLLKGEKPPRAPEDSVVDLSTVDTPDTVAFPDTAPPQGERRGRRTPT